MRETLSLKQKSESRFEELARELPTRKNENYRYTSLRNIDLERKVTNDGELNPDIIQQFEGKDGVLLVNALGAVQFFGKPEDFGVSISEELNDYPAVFENDVFTHLSVSHAIRPISIVIEDRFEMKKPLTIVLDFDAQTNSFFQPIEIKVGLKSKASFIIEKTGVGQKNGKLPLSVIFTQVLAFRDSTVTLNEWNNFGMNVQDFSRTSVRLESGAKVSEQKVFTGSGILQYRQEIECLGENSEYKMNSAVRGESDQHFDFWYHSRHPVKNTKSKIEHWAVMADRATAIFNGNMIITDKGIGTEASQTNHNKLLSSGATINAIPKLEIATDEVKCAHGARVVPMDQNQLYYLMARGIPENESKRMLVNAFTDPVVENFLDEEMKQKIRDQLQSKSAGDIATQNKAGRS